jgi:hypothetical protein
MADKAFGDTSAPGSVHTLDSGTRAAKSADQTLTTRDLKNKASNLASSSADAIKEQASEFADAARDMGAEVTDRVKEKIEDEKEAGAEYVSGIANAMRRAAEEFDEDLPIAGTYMRKAASQVEAASDAVKNGDLNDLVRGTQSFARRQPAAFLGMAVLAGFGVVRFLKSSAEDGGTANRR